MVFAVKPSTAAVVVVVFVEPAMKTCFSPVVSAPTGGTFVRVIAFAVPPTVGKMNFCNWTSLALAW